MRIGHHQQIERFEAFHSLRHARDGIAAMAEHDHRLEVIALLHLIPGQRHGIEIPRGRDARRAHHGGAIKPRHH